MQSLAGDVPGLRAGQEQRQPGDLAGNEFVCVLGAVEAVVVGLRRLSGGDGVDSDAAGPHPLGLLRGPRGKCGLGGGGRTRPVAGAEGAQIDDGRARTEVIAYGLHGQHRGEHARLVP
ncbi:Uncharacterised protein [Mycobacteroides abscessus subsp. abscessus]|nr:Uncharacterised protein [Mycobacteroides abscessus subsp. abscessus]